MSRKTRRLGILFAGMIGLCAALVYFAPSVTGTIIEDHHEKQDLDQTLAACKSDEVVYVVFYNKYASESATFNFTTKKLTGGDADGGPTRSVFYNINLAYGVTFSDEDVSKIKSLLATMPAPIIPTVGTISYRDQLHLAFYRNGQKIIYHYPKFTAPPQLADLCKALQIPEHDR